jgi:transglutaminase-like putative cysteine protease
VARLIRFVHDYLADTFRGEAASVLDLLQDRHGDCTEHALLFTTLARASGIPARDVAGLVYLGDQAQAFGGHAWNEVLLDGRWVPVDPSWGETDVNATHIRFGSGTNELVRVLRILGKLEFTLRDVKHRKP